MYEILIITFLIIALAIVALVLIQKGKGADMGASFGAGASATLFGSAGTGNFLTRTTTVLGILFFVVSIALANLGSQKSTDDKFWNLEGRAAATEQSKVQKDLMIPESTTLEQNQTKPNSDIPE